MSKSSVPWIEKYRPKRTDDIVQHSSIRKVCNHIKKNKNMPNMLYYGPPGTGKTSVAFALSMELYGPKVVKNRVLELNASDERGIKIVRDKIIKFAKLSMGEADPNYACPPFRMIILDEVDAMTKDAQGALRKVMEDNIETTRFILICNYKSDIIDAIKSRCTKFKFSAINPENAVSRLRDISDNEGLNITDDAIRMIAETGKGDIRSSINMLQNLKYRNSEIITVNEVKNITSFIDKHEIKDLWDSIVSGSYRDIYKQTGLLARKAYPMEHIFSAVTSYIDEYTQLSDEKKASIYEHLSHTERRNAEGGDDFIQLVSVAVYIHGLMKKLVGITEISTF